MIRVFTVVETMGRTAHRWYRCRGTEQLDQPGALRIGAGDSRHPHRRAELADVARGIGGAARIIRFGGHLDHRHRRLGRMRDTLPQMNSSSMRSPATRMRPAPKRSMSWFSRGLSIGLTRKLPNLRSYRCGFLLRQLREDRQAQNISGGLLGHR